MLGNSYDVIVQELFYLSAFRSMIERSEAAEENKII